MNQTEILEWKMSELKNSIESFNTTVAKHKKGSANSKMNHLKSTQSNKKKKEIK